LELGLTDRWKVTITFYAGNPEVYRNQTDAQVKAHERRYLTGTDAIKNVRVEREPRIKIVENK
jgi:hypothetical protein